MSAKPLLSVAALLASMSSLLMPVVGVATAPLLARALGADGRGELAAALAPGTLMLSAATIGLPEALTFVLATRTDLTRRALLIASAVASVGGLVSFGLVLTSGPFLSGGSSRLLSVLIITTAVSVPALYVNLLRGAATGLQLWRLIAYERITMALSRAALIVILAVTGSLTLITAVLATVLPQIAVGGFYLNLLRRGRGSPTPVEAAGPPAVGRVLLSYGLRVWLGSVSSIVLGRSAQLLIVPLAGSQALGLFTIATTISDLPLIAAAAVQSALFGVASRARDAAQFTSASRTSFILAALLCASIAATVRLWLGPLFGSEFDAAALPVVILLGSALICVPGLMSASAVAAWGRPELRTVALIVTVLVNIGLLFVFVPTFGVYGACWTSLLSNAVLTCISVVGAARLLGVPARDFVLPRRGDWRATREVVKHYVGSGRQGR